MEIIKEILFYLSQIYFYLTESKILICYNPTILTVHYSFLI